jgi:hypothetical protein
LSKSEANDAPLWGVPQIARHIGKSERETYYYLQKGYLPATKVGTVWVAIPSKLDARLRGELEAVVKDSFDFTQTEDGWTRATPKIGGAK